MDNHTIIVFDFETSNINPDLCEIVQVAGVAVNPVTLEIFPGSEFNSLMCPLDWDNFDDCTIAVHKKTREELLKAPHPNEVWRAFTSWTRQFTMGGSNSKFSVPIAAGHNILGFDLPIARRYCLNYGPKREEDSWGGKRVDQGLFSPLTTYDTLQQARYWLWDRPELGKFSLNTLRDYFGMPKESIENAHDALQDVKDTAVILKKFLNITRTCAPWIIWKDCFNDEKVKLEIERRQKSKNKPKERWC